jgi:hypothetical protein
LALALARISCSHFPPAAAFFNVEQIVMPSTQTTTVVRSVAFEALALGLAWAQIRECDKLKIVEGIIRMVAIFVVHKIALWDGTEVLFPDHVVQ